VEHNEANLQGIDAVDKAAPVMDQKAPGDTAMNDTESESDREEVSAGAALSVPLNQVIFSICIRMLRKRNFSKICTSLRDGQDRYKISKKQLFENLYQS
jgi:hypothetical protein